MAQSQTCIVQIAVASAQLVIFCSKGSVTDKSECRRPEVFFAFGTPKLATTADDGPMLPDANSIPDPKIAPSEIDVGWPNDRLNLLTKKKIYVY